MHARSLTPVSPADTRGLGADWRLGRNYERRGERITANWVCCALLALCFGGPLRGQTAVYWDTNGAVAGASAGATASGTWSNTGQPNWSADPAGTLATVDWNAVVGNKVAVFSAGTNATGSSVVTVSGSVGNLAGITFEEGSLLISGGTSLALGAPAIVRVAAGASAAIATPLTGAFSVTKTGPGSLTLTGANSVSGTVTVSSGSLVLSGNGSLLNATAYVLNSSGALTLSNATTNSGDRLAGVGLTANGGLFEFTHSGAPGTNYSETLGALTLNSGGLNVNLSQAATVQTSAVTVSSLTRNPGGTVLFSGTGLGESARNQFVVTTAPTLTNGILPWAVVTKDGGVTYDLATHGGNGTSITAFTGYNTGLESTWTSGTVNARPTTDQMLTGNRTVNALVLDNGIDLLGPNGNRTLTLAGGLVLQTGGSSLINNNGNSEYVLAFGASEGFITTQGTLQLNRGNSPGLTGSGGITKSGAGTFITNTANANTGLLTINEGTWRAVTNAGSVSGGGVVMNGGTLELAHTANLTFTNTNTTVAGNATVTSDRSSTGSGVTYTLGTLSIGAQTLNVSAGSNVTGGTAGITFGATAFAAGEATFNTGANTVLTLGALNDGGSAITLNKSGAGTLALATAATSLVDGTTVNVDAGTLQSNQATALGSLARINLQSGATFGVGAAQTISGLNGTGGTVSLANNLTIGNASNLNSTFGGVITGTGELIKEGTGVLTLSGASTRTGVTTVNAGVLSINTLANGGSVSAIGQSSNAAANLILNGGTLRYTGAATSSDRLFTLGANGGTIDASGTGALSFTNPGSLLSSGTGNRTLTLTGSNTGNNTLAGVLANPGTGTTSLSKTGVGKWILSNANTFTGPVSVNAGTLALHSNSALGIGAAGTTVASGATLQIDGGRLTTSNGTLSLAGTGVGAAGALVGSGGNNRWDGSIVLNGNTTVSTSGSGYLALGTTSPAYNRALSDPLGTPSDTHTLSLGSNTLTLTGTTSAFDNRAIYVNSRITGTGNLVVNMTNAADTVRLTANMNTFTGSTIIQQGTLSLATLYNTYPNDPVHPNFFGINGPMVIGDGLGATSSAILQIGSGTLFAEMMKFTTPVTLHRDGLFSLASAQSIDALTFNGGRVDLVGLGGLLYLNNTVTVNASAETAFITGATGQLSLTIQQGPVPIPNANRLFNVANGASVSDLTISATINNGSITKNGEGTMTLTGNSAAGYEGTTTINHGIVNIQHGNALGQADGSAASGTTVNGNGTTNGTLQLQGGITVGNERLTLNNTGFGNNGALQNVSGNNTWNGQVIVNQARVQSDSGTLTLAGNVDIVSALDVRGAGTTAITGAVSGASGTLTKNGTGTLILSGNNTFGGTTTITQGVVSLQSNTGLGSAGAGTTVAGNGAALELSNATNGNLNTIAEPLTLNGTGIGGTGALRNAAGANTFGGLVTLQSASLITANSGTSLTLSGGVTSSGQALTIGTTTQNGNVTIAGNLANGSGSLTKNGSGSLTFASSSSLLSGAVGSVSLNAGTMTVGNGVNDVTLQTGNFSSLAGTTLTVATGGSVVANYSGTTTFSGAMAGSGEFEKTGSGTLVFNNTFSAPNLTLTLSGGTLSLLSGQFTFGTIHITGNTILDFNNSANTFLSSAHLVIEAGVVVTVNNWVSVANNTSLSTVWYATNTVNAGTLAGVDRVGGPPLNQIVFSNYTGLTTTWVAGNHSGWFDHEIRPTPEPATYGAILLGGCFGLFGWRRWRSRRKR